MLERRDIRKSIQWPDYPLTLVPRIIADDSGGPDEVSVLR